MATIIAEKSEILFLYETSYNIPNGDPFTGEQRYDEETKKILVSDVRIKRFIRSYLEDKGKTIYVSNRDSSNDAKTRLTHLAESQFRESELTDIGEIMKTCIDVKLFGGISTLKAGENNKVKLKIKTKNGQGNDEETDTEFTNAHIQFTGPVQFAFLNPSLNRVTMRMHQNTSHFNSDINKTQGTIATTTVVPYSVVQIHGWINPKVAQNTGMTDEDKKLLMEGLWYGTGGEGSSFSRSKIGQDSLLILELVYKENYQKLYGVDRLIKITPKDDKKEEQLRSLDDFVFDFSGLAGIAVDERIAKIRYYTEDKSIEEQLKKEIAEALKNKSENEFKKANEEKQEKGIKENQKDTIEEKLEKVVKERLEMIPFYTNEQSNTDNQ